MRQYLSSFVFVFLLSGCGPLEFIVGPTGQQRKHSSNEPSPEIAGPNSGNTQPTPTQTRPEYGGTNSVNQLPIFGVDQIRCDEGSIGRALSTELKEMAVCCVTLSQSGLVNGSSNFVKREGDKFVVRPAGCAATAVSGSLGELALPIEFDLAASKWVTFSDSLMFSEFKGSVNIHGGSDYGTTLVGKNPLLIYGKAQVSNLKFAGPELRYELRDIAGYNSLEMTNIELGSAGETKGGLTLSTRTASNIGTSGAIFNFSNVKVSADKPNPVTLLNFPFDTKGIEIVPGSQFAPHIGLLGTYSDTVGVIQEKRYPVVTSLLLRPNSKLIVGPGVILKTAQSDSSAAAFKLDSSYSNYVLEIAGTEAEPVKIASFSDDRLGGDSNGDGNATQGSNAQLVSSDGACGSIAIHQAILYQTLVGVRGTCAVRIGNIRIEESQNGSAWRFPFYLSRGESSRNFPNLTIDGPVQAKLATDTSLLNGELSARATIFAAVWASSGSEGSVVKGLENLTVENTSQLESKFAGKLYSNAGSICGLAMNSEGVSSPELKSSIFFNDSQNLKQCQ